MIELKRLLKTDIMKLNATGIGWLHIGIPSLGILVFLSYYSYTTWENSYKVLTYLQTLCIVFPILIGIITSIVADQEYEAGSFQNILSSSEKKYLSFISKYLIVFGLGILSTILAVIGSYVGFSIMGYNTLPLHMYLSVVGILIGSNIFLYTLHFFLSFRLSKGISIGIGIVESLISALFLTGMGDGRWHLFPSAWSVRFISSLVQKYENPNISMDPFFKLGIILSISGTILIFIMILIWFNRWE